jgi:16S rRNA (cytidine1402-2'-O)-methyltransferase
MASGTLYVVATPIGNLEDITLRALRVLREVDVIAAEDTRRTARLLHHYAITTPTTSFHQHNRRARTRDLLGRLAAGQSVALVSDAGTPLVSDPGQELVAAARHAGLIVSPIPGASALMALLAAAGIPADRFCFFGFVPRRALDRKAWLRAHVARSTVPVVVFEAPHRLHQLLTDALDILGDIPIVLGRELTKIHEEMVECQISAAIGRFVSPRGEFVLAFLPSGGPDEAFQRPDEEQLSQEIGYLTENEGMTRRQAAAIVAKRHGLKTNQVYRAFDQSAYIGRITKQS